MSKKPKDMTLEEIELELGNDEIYEIRKRMLVNLYEQKMKETTIEI